MSLRQILLWSTARILNPTRHKDYNFLNPSPLYGSLLSSPPNLFCILLCAFIKLISHSPIFPKQLLLNLYTKVFYHFLFSPIQLGWVRFSLQFEIFILLVFANFSYYYRMFPMTPSSTVLPIFGSNHHYSSQACFDDIPSPTLWLLPSKDNVTTSDKDHHLHWQPPPFNSVRLLPSTPQFW